MIKFPGAKERAIEILTTGKGTLVVQTSWKEYEVEVRMVEGKPYYIWGYDRPRNAELIQAWITQKLINYTYNSVGDLKQWKDEWVI